jgi:hypothetical protein
LRWSAGTDVIQYQSPMLMRVGGEELMLGAGNTYLYGIEPASGVVRWRVAHGGGDFYQASSGRWCSARSDSCSSTSA